MPDDDKEKTALAPVDLFTLTEIPVTLTYTGFGAPPFTFFLRPCLNEEEQALRQTMLALSDKEREAGKHAHNVEMVARLATRTPEGIVNFSGDIRKHFALGPVEDKGAEQRNLMKRKVVNDVLTRYYSLTQPSEFFRGL
jgi:hypothetical protein